MNGRISSLSQYGNKFFDGCWLLAPKREDFFKFRFCFFIHDIAVDRDLQDKLNVGDLIDEDWRFHNIAGFLRKAGLGVLYAVARTVGDALVPGGLKWKIYRYLEEQLCALNLKKFFCDWPGRGSPSCGREWNDELRSEFLRIPEEDLVSFLLNELFYTSFIKGVMGKPVNDSRILSISITMEPPYERRKPSTSYGSLTGDFGRALKREFFGDGE